MYKQAEDERNFIKLYNMGNSYLEKKEFDSAIEFYEKNGLRKQNFSDFL